MSRYQRSPKISPKEWVKQFFAQPSKLFYQEPIIYMSGDELELQNFRAVVDYTSDYLLVDMGRGWLRITGDELVILALEKSRLVLRGRILNLSFSE